MSMRTALYVRVSTDKQSESIENQYRVPQQIAQHRGWTAVEVYGERSALDAMLNDASARSLTWSWLGVIVRVERSLIDLLSTIQHLEAAGVELYLDQQNIHTTG